MKCPHCGALDTRVIETRSAEEGSSIRRRRECPACSFRFTTYERLEQQRVLWVSKKDGRREAFDRAKLIRGISRACERLPVSLDVIEDAAGRIEARLREKCGEVTSMEIGELVMEELSRINKVAYVRFASVYREFTDLFSFQQEIARLVADAHDESDPAHAPSSDAGRNMP
ncbi:MAG: transcriptional regulator NrdR [Pyramidobacter sp.]|nr:transcriptional regulator NrdR [Pyramidobacter sp.]